MAVASYMPQPNAVQVKKEYQELLQWLTKLLVEDHPRILPNPTGRRSSSKPTHKPNHKSQYPSLKEFCNTTSLTHIIDPHTPTYMPINSLLDHWVLRPLPSTLFQNINATITASDTDHSDHRVLTISIPQIGDASSQFMPTPPNIPATRDQPPFILPIPKPLINLCQLGSTTTQKARKEASKSLQDILSSPTIIPAHHIEQVAKHVIIMPKT
jgi:hypothetical protein